jgi:hypothetical protein
MDSLVWITTYVKIQAGEDGYVEEEFRQNVSWTDTSYPRHLLALLYVLSVRPDLLTPLIQFPRMRQSLGARR